MSREEFPEVKAGQKITEGRANREGRVLERVARMVPGAGMSGRHSGSHVQMGTPPPWNQGIVTVTDVVESGVPDPPIYYGTKRGYNFDGVEWRDQKREWQIDAKGLDAELSVGDRLVCYWDAQRGMLVPMTASAFEVPGFMLAEDHPGQGILFDIWLGEWSPATHSWIYAETAANMYQCIDWRFDVPYPDKCATGLGVWRLSDAHDRIMEVVALDCSSPGCDESSSSATSSSSDNSSQSSASSPSSPSSDISSPSSPSSPSSGGSSQSSPSSVSSISSTSSPSSGGSSVSSASSPSSGGSSTESSVTSG